MMTVGMVTALALVGGHAAVARAIWPGERVENPGPAPDPLLKARAAASDMVAAIKTRQLKEAESALAAAQKVRTELQGELGEARKSARIEIKALTDERAVLRRELARLRRTEVLTAAEDEDDETESGGGDGAAAPPAGLCP